MRRPGARRSPAFAWAASCRPREYQHLLLPHCRHLDLWETTYWQAARGDDAVVEWMKGTTLLPYLARLEADAAEDFLAACRAQTHRRLPTWRSLDRRFFPFRRIFFVAQR
jgi:trans-aconitate 2-methyltransferase